MITFTSLHYPSKEIEYDRLARYIQLRLPNIATVETTAVSARTMTKEPTRKLEMNIFFITPKSNSSTLYSSRILLLQLSLISINFCDPIQKVPNAYGPQLQANKPYLMSHRHHEHQPI